MDKNVACFDSHRLSLFEVSDCMTEINRLGVTSKVHSESKSKWKPADLFSLEPNVSAIFQPCNVSTVGALDPVDLKKIHRILYHKMFFIETELCSIYGSHSIRLLFAVQ